jgi:hypothetical protein
MRLAIVKFMFKKYYYIKEAETMEAFLGDPELFERVFERVTVIFAN